MTVHQHDVAASAGLDQGAARRRALGATMALALRHQQAKRAVESEARHEIAAEGRVGAGAGAGAGAPPRVAASEKSVPSQVHTESAVGFGAPGPRGQPRGPSQTIADLMAAAATDADATVVAAGRGRGRGVGVGVVAPHALTTTTTEPAAVYMSNAESIVAGLREGTAAGRRRIASQVAIHLGGDSTQTHVSGPGAPPADSSAVAWGARATLPGRGQLSAHVYGHAVPSQPAPSATVTVYDRTFRGSRETPALGASKAPEWRSATQAQVAPDHEFGATAVVAPAGAPVGPKKLRTSPGGLSLRPELGHGN
jgi:hypothetical protein